MRMCCVLQSAKREIESFRVGRLLWGIAVFPQGLVEILDLNSVIPEVLICVCMCVCLGLYVCESKRAKERDRKMKLKFQPVHLHRERVGCSLY